MRERQHVRECLQDGRVVALTEGAREERHRQEDDVHDRGRSFRGPDQRGDCESETGERDRTEEDEHDDRRGVVRQVRVVEQAAEDVQRHRLQGEDDQGRAERGGEVDAGRERSRAQPFQDPVLASDHERDRHACEARVGGAVADHPDEQDIAGGIAVDLAVVERPEQDEEHHREDEDEDRRLAIAPEDQLLGLQLVKEQPHASPSSTSSR